MPFHTFLDGFTGLILETEYFIRNGKFCLECCGNAKINITDFRNISIQSFCFSCWSWGNFISFFPSVHQYHVLPIVRQGDSQTQWIRSCKSHHTSNWWELHPLPTCKALMIASTPFPLSIFTVYYTIANLYLHTNQTS